MLKRILNLIFPSRCIFCGEKIPPEAYRCEKCALPEKACFRIFNIKPGRKGTKPHLLKVASPCIYSGFYRRSLHLFKFRGKTCFAESYAKLICDMGIYDKTADYISYVPMTKRKVRERGYNQSELIAKKLSEISDIPLKEILIKSKDNTAQHSLSKEERRKNVKGIYELAFEVKNKNIILVDDIVTTGATICECAAVLYRAGASLVSGICAADAQTINRSEDITQ